jgi:hypothetical protein
MSETAGFDINITLSDAAQGWQPHLMPSSFSGVQEIPQHDEFDLDIRYDEIVGDPPAQGPMLGLSGPFGITCSNSCGVFSGCANSGCGGITCTCQPSGICPTANLTCANTCANCVVQDVWGSGDDGSGDGSDDSSDD